MPCQLTGELFEETGEQRTARVSIHTTATIADGSTVLAGIVQVFVHEASGDKVNKPLSVAGVRANGSDIEFNLVLPDGVAFRYILITWVVAGP